MTTSTNPQHIRRVDKKVQRMRSSPDVSQEMARIVEAMRDPFACAVALMADGAVQMPPSPPPPTPRKQRQKATPRRRTAPEILAVRRAPGISSSANAPDCDGGRTP